VIPVRSDDGFLCRGGRGRVDPRHRKPPGSGSTRRRDEGAEGGEWDETPAGTARRERERRQADHLELGGALGAAEDLADLCYIVVRSHLVDGDADAARRAAIGCRRRTRLTPRQDLHPPTVHRLLADINQQVEVGEAARLTIQMQPRFVERCSVLINGQRVGGEDRAIRVFAPEGRYEVGLRCGDEPVPLRLHRVELAERTTRRLVLDPELDQAMAGGEAVLTYAEGGANPTLVQRHARTIGEALDARGILLITTSGRTIEIERVPTAARAQLDRAANPGMVERAVDAVLAGRSFRAEGVGAGAVGTAAAGEPPIVGPLVLGVAGLAGVGVAIGTVLAAGCVERDAGGRCVIEDEVAVVPTALYGAAGGIALTGSILWFLFGGDEDETPREAPGVSVGPTSVEILGRF